MPEKGKISPNRSEEAKLLSVSFRHSPAERGSPPAETACSFPSRSANTPSPAPERPTQYRHWLSKQSPKSQNCPPLPKLPLPQPAAWLWIQATRLRHRPPPRTSPAFSRKKAPLLAEYALLNQKIPAFLPPCCSFSSSRTGSLPEGWAVSKKLCKTR